MKDGTGKIVFVNLSGVFDGLSLDSTKFVRMLPLIMKYVIERNYFSINAYDTTSKLESEEQTIQGQNEKEIMAEDIIKLPGDISEEAKKAESVYSGNSSCIVLFAVTISIVLIGNLITRKKFPMLSNKDVNGQA